MTAKLVQVIVKRILSVIAGTTLDLTEHPIGIDSRVQQVLKLLKLSAPDVRIIGIHGMAGIGKTTLSKAIYNTISHQFQGRSFISNIREVSKQPNGLVSLQNQLIRDIFKGKIQPVRGVSQGTSIMKQRFHTKPILIVLDDVDDKKQLDALVGERDSFCAGTRIIITTRDEHILNILNLQQEPKWCQIYTVERLNRIQSLQLLSHHAFRKDWPLEEYMKLSEEVVSLLAGLPLSLEVFGSLLFDKRSTKEWEDVLDNLKQIEPDDVQSTLKLSYDQLDEAEKCLFLDVASFFIGIDKDSAIHAWKGCGLFPYIGIKVLQHKSLLSINEKNNVIEMHDQLRDMGREIIRHESPLEPGNRSRLWSHDEILHLLNDRKGTESVESITLNFKDVKKRGKKTYLKAQAFAAMPNLRLLRLNYAKIQGAYEDFPRRLKWLEWQGCPLESLPCNFNLEEIAVLDLCKSRICQVLKKQVRQTNKIFDKLKVLNLSHLDHLTVTPDLANFPRLVRLVLEGCSKLVTIHESIGKLIDLVILNMSDCKELVKLPHHICHLKSLKVLMLSCCLKLDTLPKRLGDLESLTDLVLDGTAVKVLPKSVVQLSNLCRLSLNMCESLKELPDSIGSLHSLEVLILDCTSIRRIPDSIGSLEKLQKLSARNCMSLVSLPNSIGNARSLIKLLLDGTCIVELPNSVGLLDQLQVLSVSDCMNLTSLPECMGKLSSLSRLKMQNTSISYLPEDVSLLVNLHTFDMELCPINRLPQNFGSLSNLRVLNLRGNSNLDILPPTFSLLRSLQELDLSKCNLSNGVIPNDFGRLSSLKFLMLDSNDFCSLPSSIGDLSALKTLYLRYCQELQSLPQLPASLTFLDLSCCNTLESVDLTNLVSLQTLYLSDCEGLLNVCGLEKMKFLRLLHIRGCGNLDSATKDSLVKETFERLEVLEISGVQASEFHLHHQFSIWLPNTSKPKLKVVEAILSLDVTFNRLILPIVRIQVTIMSGDKEVYGITSSFRWATKNSDYGTYCFRCQENDPMLDHIQDGDWIRVSIERIPWCRELQVNKCYIYIAYRPRETPGLLDFFLEENPDFQDHVFTTRELLEYTSSDDESVSW
ncbi:disease resistance protein RUN1-like isoform X2 [Nymphaea colorata]|uniref:disease resistance protein RUN1-like isoform X2 n=1 Tax=Nymphaea colorata TaxID=210225 RepID=UPI00129D4F05|nr:disease resistance protein RUN1-like isoform X2 [Nymphaea colorata]